MKYRIGIAIGIIACVLVLMIGLSHMTTISHANNTEREVTKTQAVSEVNIDMTAGIASVINNYYTDSSLQPSEIMPGSEQAKDDIQPEAGAARSESSLLSETQIAETEASDQEENEYADLAIADVTNYVNIRTEPNTDSSIVGKIYDGAVAQILSVVTGEDGDWFQVVSGNADGYIKAEFFLYGDAALAVIDDYVTRYATVIANRLNVRSQPNIESSRVGYIDNGERVRILENQGDWLKVQYTEGVTGFVSAEYVTVSEEFIYAKTLEEEAQEQAELRALQERRRQSEAQAAENTAITTTITPPAAAYSTNGELRQEIINYARQFLGNRYIHGGKTLAGGTDCSGFTSLIYAEFGYSLGRTPESQLAGAGRGIDYSAAQPGDIICYGSGGRCTHVAIYIGDGQIIHSANSRKGVIIGRADYDTILGVRNVID